MKSGIGPALERHELFHGEWLKDPLRYCKLCDHHHRVACTEPDCKCLYFVEPDVLPARETRSRRVHAPEDEPKFDERLRKEKAAGKLTDLEYNVFRLRVGEEFSYWVIKPAVWAVTEEIGVTTIKALQSTFRDNADGSKTETRWALVKLLETTRIPCKDNQKIADRLGLSFNQVERAVTSLGKKGFKV